MLLITSDDDDSFSPPAEPRIVLAVLDVIHQHVAPPTGDLVVTPDFLFSVCSVLVSTSERSQPELLLAVLRCLRQRQERQREGRVQDIPAQRGTSADG